MSRNSFVEVLWTQNRAAFVLLLVLLLGCCTFWLLQDYKIVPQIIRLRAQQDQLQQQLQQRELQVTTTGMPMSTAERIDKDLRRFRELIPAKQQFSGFIGELFSWAEQAELDIDQVSYQPELVAELGMLGYGLNFSVTGTYEQLKRFIHLLENSSRILIIENIALTGANSPDEGDSVVSLQIQLRTYFQEVTQ